MVHKITLLIPFIIASIVIGILGGVFNPIAVKRSTNMEFPTGIVKIGHDIIKAQVAKSNAEHERWLMFRHDKIPLNSAMLLVYMNPDLYSILLLNIEYNLDLIWFDEKGNAVYLINDAPPCKSIFDLSDCTYKNTQPAKYVIAATSGFITYHHITKGSKMTVISI
jgi:uncharacterized membrane protein (UPF0127 family)